MPGIVYDFQLTGVDLWHWTGAPRFIEFGCDSAARIRRSQKIILSEAKMPIEFIIRIRCQLS